MSCSSAPDTDIWFKPSTKTVAYSTIRTWIKATLPPLMIKFWILTFGYDKFAFRFSKLQISTNFVDNYSALFALQYVWKPAVCEFMAKVTKIKRLGFAFLPFVFGRSEFISYHPTLYGSCLQILRLKDQNYGQNQYRYRNENWDGKNHWL